MINFEFYSPTRFIFGEDEENKVGQYIREYHAQKVMVFHYGTQEPHETELMRRVYNSLTQANLPYVDFCGIKPNPLFEDAVKAYRTAEAEGADFMLAVGGGSVIDTAKFVAIVLKNGGDVEECWEKFYIGSALVEEMAPVGTILTISGTGSEGSNSSVIKRGTDKYFIFGGDVVRPTFSIMDPKLTFTVPAYQSASGITDMFCHLHERYFTPVEDNYLTDCMSEALMRTIIKYAPVVIADPANYNARAQIMWTGTIAHNETCGVGRIPDLGVHMMQNPISGFYNSAHGAGCGVLTLAWMRYVYQDHLPRFVRYFTQVWDVENDPFAPEAVVLEGIRRQETFYRAIGMPVNGADVGIQEEDIPALAAAALCGGESIGNMHPLYREDIEKILKLTLQ